MANGNGHLKTAVGIAGIALGFVANLGAVFAAWNSLSKDVAVVKTEVAGIRENVGRHEQEITKLRDDRRAAHNPPAAGEPAA